MDHQAAIVPTAGSAALRVTIARNGAVSPVPPEMLQRTRALAILATLQAPDGGRPNFTYRAVQRNAGSRISQREQTKSTGGVFVTRTIG